LLGGTGLRKRESRCRSAVSVQGEDGQVVVLVALMLVPLLLLVGLGVDFGMMYMAKARLQRAVDASALSAAESFYQAGVDPADRARQFLAANCVIGPPPLTCDVAFPDTDTLTVRATQSINTYFLCLLPGLESLVIAAEATVVLDSYAEMPIKPTGIFGKQGQTNPSVFGPEASYSFGDAYSPTRIDSGQPNPEHGKLPYGYLFRLYVPPTYSSDGLVVELFDPDCYNAPIVQHFVINPKATPVATMTNPEWSQDPNRERHNTGVKLNHYGDSWHKYFRVDENRGPSGEQDRYESSWSTETRYTLWHFSTELININPFANPATLGTKVAEYVVRNDPNTDLKWITPPGFTVELGSWGQELDGSRNFYLYVQTIDGSSENGFDIRTGPPGQAEEPNVNEQQIYSWDSGGSMVFARRAYPMNNADIGTYWVYLTQVPENAAGMTLYVRHFDNDGDNQSIPYYLEDASGTNYLVATGKLSGSGRWYCSDTNRADVISIPAKGTPLYETVFGGDRKSAWLKGQYPMTIRQDTSVWELLYIRPRLLK